MTTPRNADALIKAYLADGPAELPDPSFDAVRGEIERTRQRARFIPLAIPRLSESAGLLAVAALVLIAFVGINLAAQRGQRGVGAPTDTTSPTPTARPTPTADLTPSPRAEPTVDPTIPPGTHELTAEFPIRVTMKVPAGWFDCSIGPLEQGVCGRPDNSGVSFMIIENVVADPCVNKGLDPPVGPTIHDLARAIAALPDFQATTPIDVTVDGHPGVELTVTAPVAASCGLLTWMGPDRTNGVGPGEVNRLRIVDVDGARVLIAAAFHPTAAAPGIPADVKQAFESVRFP